MKKNCIIVDADKIAASRLGLSLNCAAFSEKISILNSIDKLTSILNDTIVIVKIELDNYENILTILESEIKVYENLKILIHCRTINKELLKFIFDSNLSGFVYTDYLIENTLLVINNLMNSKVFYLCPSSTYYVVKNYLFNDLEIALKNLSKQQISVAKHLSQGLTYKEISEVMGLSLNTTRMHIKLIYKKLKISNKYKLINLRIND